MHAYIYIDIYTLRPLGRSATSGLGIQFPKKYTGTWDGGGNRGVNL